MLCASHQHQKISAHYALEGLYDFRSNPYAPPGIRCIVHTPINVKESWRPHGKPGFYVGPSYEYYRCYKVYIPATKKTVIIDNIEFTEDNTFEIPYKLSPSNS